MDNEDNGVRTGESPSGAFLFSKLELFDDAQTQSPAWRALLGRD
jgi:hypothetical protein